MIFDTVSRVCVGPLSRKSLLAERGGAPVPPPAHPEALFQLAAALPTLRQATDGLIEEALRRAGGKQGAAARLLGISPQALSRRLNRRQSSLSPRRASRKEHLPIRVASRNDGDAAAVR
jgi:DNA-binding NtrC family response regulator